MAAKWPTELGEALTMVNHEQVKTDVGIVQAKLFFEEAGRSWGMQAKSPTGGTAALYHMLNPWVGSNQLRQLELGKEIVAKY